MSRKLLVLATLLASGTTATAAATALADETRRAPVIVTTGVGVEDDASPAPAPGPAPTSTTTTTSADDVSGSTGTSGTSAALVMPAPRESVTVYERHRPHKALFITGASIFLTTYALTASFAAAGERAADRDLFVPGAGPFMNLANRNCSRGCITDTRDTALLITSGVLQNIGAVLMITSAFIPNKVPAARITAGSVNMQVAPTAGAGSAGLGALGTF